MFRRILICQLDSFAQIASQHRAAAILKRGHDNVCAAALFKLLSHFDAHLLNPELSRRLRGLGNMLWERTSLDRGLVELAISITGRHWEANVEWAAHAPRAIEYGIPASVIDDVYAGKRPSGSPEQVLMYDLCMSLHESHRLPIELYRRGVESFGERGVMEITAIIGFYTLISMTLNAFEVGLAPGLEAPFRRDP